MSSGRHPLGHDLPSYYLLGLLDPSSDFRTTTETRLVIRDKANDRILPFGIAVLLPNSRTCVLQRVMARHKKTSDQQMALSK